MMSLCNNVFKFSPCTVDILKLQRACNDMFGPYKVDLDVHHFTLKGFKTYETDLLTIVLFRNSSH